MRGIMRPTDKGLKRSFDEFSEVTEEGTLQLSRRARPARFMSNMAPWEMFPWLLDTLGPDHGREMDGPPPWYVNGVDVTPQEWCEYVRAHPLPNSGSPVHQARAFVLWQRMTQWEKEGSTVCGFSYSAASPSSSDEPDLKHPLQSSVGSSTPPLTPGFDAFCYGYKVVYADVTVKADPIFVLSRSTPDVILPGAKRDSCSPRYITRRYSYDNR